MHATIGAVIAITVLFILFVSSVVRIIKSNLTEVCNSTGISYTENILGRIAICISIFLWLLLIIGIVLSYTSV